MQGSLVQSHGEFPTTVFEEAGVSWLGEGALNICKALKMRKHIRFGETDFLEMPGTFIVGGQEMVVKNAYVCSVPSILNTLYASLLEPLPCRTQALVFPVY